jgi:hypothetical protein
MAGVKEVPRGDNVMDLFRTRTATIGGTEYTFRELSVKENDACTTAARQADGSFDGRIMMRLMVLKSIIEPNLNDSQLMELPQRLYLRLCDVVSDINADEEIDEDEDPKNA